MKNIKNLAELFLLSTLIFVSGNVMAASKKDAAVSFLRSKWAESEANARKKTASGRIETRVNEISLIENISLVNVEISGREGFVLYKGMEGNIVGYSDCGILDPENLPEQLADMLIALDTETVNSYPVKVAAVTPFIKTQWHQLAPFNGKCPTYQGIRSAAGCTGVAVAQVLNYYKPQKNGNFTIEYKDDISGSEITVNYAKSNYEWSNILDDYTGDYTQAQADAVAKLVFEAGAAGLSEYSPYSTSGKPSYVAMDRYYDFNAEFLYREGFPTSVWMERIYKELKEKRPVLYGGSSISGSHEFVIDGNDEDGFVHINWGWGGEADGYYDLASCKPSNTASDEQGYSSKQMMVIGLRPRMDVDEPYRERFVCAGVLSYGVPTETYPTVATYFTTNYYSDKVNPSERIDMKGKSIVPVNAQTGEPLELPVIDESVEAYREYGLFPSFKTLSIRRNIYDVSKAGVGKYYWKVGYAPVGMEGWYYDDLPLKPWAIVNEEGFVTEQGFDEYEGNIPPFDYTLSFELKALEPLTDVISGAPFFVKFQTESLIDWPSTSSGTTCLVFENIDTKKRYVTDYLKLYNEKYQGLVSEGVVLVDAPVNTVNAFSMPTGRYQVYAGEEDGSESSKFRTVDNIFVDVKEKADYPVIQYDVKEAGTRLVLSSGVLYGNDVLNVSKPAYLVLYESSWNYLKTVNNVYAPSEINVYLCESSDTALENEIYIGTVKEELFNRNSRGLAEVASNLYPLNGEYMVYLRYMTPEGEKDILPARWDWIDEKTGLGMTPALVNITGIADETLPKIEISSVSSNGNRISFLATNKNSKEFSGVISVRWVIKDKTEIKTFESEHTTLGVAETRRIEIDVPQYDTEAVVNLQFATLTNLTRSSSDVRTLAIRPDGNVANYSLQGVTSGVEELPEIASDAVVTIYGLDGVKVYEGKYAFHSLPSGFYIVISDKSARKIRIGSMR